MIISGHPHTVVPGEAVPSTRRGPDADACRWRRHRPAFTLAEFCGTHGAWTVPHLHRAMEESFFVLDGYSRSRSAPGVEAGSGRTSSSRAGPHTRSPPPRRRPFLTLMVPGGLEEMFFELAGLPPNSIRDPAIRAAVSARYDSIPVYPWMSHQRLEPAGNHPHPAPHPASRTTSWRRGPARCSSWPVTARSTTASHCTPAGSATTCQPRTGRLAAEAGDGSTSWRRSANELGSLSAVARVVKVVVFVNSAPDFTDQHLVANGATDLLVHAFGKTAGRPARSAVGVAALPLGFAIEIEAVVETT